MRREDCWCADKRKPCSYHEGYDDGWEAAWDEALIAYGDDPEHAIDGAEDEA